MKYYIKTFGCQQNHADSERIEADFKARGYTKARSYKSANYVIINTCMIRQTAENRVYGLVNNLGKIKQAKLKKGEVYKIIITGCMIGIVYRDKTGKYLKLLKQRMHNADEFMPIEEVGFNLTPVRTDKTSAWVPISNGCNNFCTFCIVPFTRGREISRPYEDIISECLELKKKGYKNVMLLGQNVNSYGADLLVGEKNIQVMRDADKTYFDIEKAKGSFLRNSPGAPMGVWRSKKTMPSFLKNVKPVYVKHLGRQRIPTLFPHLLNEVAKMGFEKVEFMSSNPWDFSDELIDVMAKNENISRSLHLPVQSGDDAVLKRMNRWYSADEYLVLISKIKAQIPNMKFTTDIIVGFCGETDKEFQSTVDLCKKVGFNWAYVSMYSPRFNTAATKVFKDDVSHITKKKRWLVLENLINQPQLKKSKIH
ncbi:MAG: radical SAM protein [Candidatus Roizmanbacteria bacterium]|nr:radical SAM protein [Candidatus Roizmanbacteria bacterium]